MVNFEGKIDLIEYVSVVKKNHAAREFKETN
jgi:hypothetical protein